MSGNKYLISGGGTGGHIFPALSIANEIKRRHPDADILFVGALSRMEMEKVPAAGYRIVGLPVYGFDRRRLWRNVKVLWQLWQSMRRARQVLDEFKPDVAIGVGGYASGPMLKVAQKAGLPTVLQEQNSYAGVTNKLLAQRAECICVAYEGMERFFPADKIVLTGNPVRRALLECDATAAQARAELGLDPAKATVLVVGGSLGAGTVNSAIAAHLDTLAKQEGVQVLWQTGKNYDDRCRRDLERSGAANVKQTAFVARMDLAYRAADLVVSRAGASSISELQLLGKPSILVPSPNVAEDHQTKNAQALVDRDAAIMVRDAEARDRLVPALLDTVARRDLLDRLGANVARMALHNAAEHIVDRIDDIINRKNRHQ